MILYADYNIFKDQTSDTRQMQLIMDQSQTSEFLYPDVESELDWILCNMGYELLRAEAAVMRLIYASGVIK